MNAEQLQQLNSLLILAEKTDVIGATILARKTEVFDKFMERLSTPLLQKLNASLK